MKIPACLFRTSDPTKSQKMVYVSIGDHAFSGCISPIPIGNSVRSIGEGSFTGCSEMRHLYIHSCELTPSYSLDEGLESIVIDKGSKGLFELLVNHEFCTTEGLLIHHGMLSGYVCGSNGDGAMVRTACC